MPEKISLDIQALKEIHAGREVFYTLFYRTFIMTPDVDLYTMISDLLPQMKQLSEDSTNSALRAAVEELEKFIEIRTQLSGEELAEYDLDTQRLYTQLFCLTNSVRVCQSHYIGQDKLSRQQPYEDCLKLYARYNMPKDPRYNEDTDFVAVQMQFMAFLASRCVQAIEEENADLLKELTQEQLLFHQNHLFSWLPFFRTEIKTYETAHRLYIPLTELMIAFIEEDLTFLKLS